MAETIKILIRAFLKAAGIAAVKQNIPHYAKVIHAFLTDWGIHAPPVSEIEEFLKKLLGILSGDAVTSDQFYSVYKVSALKESIDNIKSQLPKA